MPTKIAPLEQAQVLWHRALKLVGPAADTDDFAAVLEVVRVAGNDSTIIAHALALGRTRLRGDAHDALVRRGVSLLARAVDFLGVKPGMHDAVMVGQLA
jgi:hypothetical protein